MTIIRKNADQLKQTVHLTKPLDQMAYPVRNKNGKLIIDSKYFPKHFFLIEFQDTSSNSNKMAKSCWKNENIYEVKKVIIKYELQSNQMHQYCWIENGTNLTAPLHCMPYYSFASEDEIDVWLTNEHKPIMITISVLSAIFAPLIGILFTCILAKVFPKCIRGRRPVQQTATYLTPKEIETVEHIRFV